MMPPVRMNLLQPSKESLLPMRLSVNLRGRHMSLALQTQQWLQPPLHVPLAAIIMCTTSSTLSTTSTAARPCLAPQRPTLPDSTNDIADQLLTKCRPAPSRGSPCNAHEACELLRAGKCRRSPVIALRERWPPVLPCGSLRGRFSSLSVQFRLRKAAVAGL